MRKKQIETLRNIYCRTASKQLESYQDNFYINGNMIIYFHNEYDINMDVENKNINIRNFLIDMENQNFSLINVTANYLNDGIKSVAGKKYSTNVNFQPDTKHTINARYLKAVMELLNAEKVEIPENIYKPWKVSGKYGIGYILPINNPENKNAFYAA